MLFENILHFSFKMNHCFRFFNQIFRKRKMKYFSSIVCKKKCHKNKLGLERKGWGVRFSSAISLIVDKRRPPFGTILSYLFWQTELKVFIKVPLASIFIEFQKRAHAENISKIYCQNFS